MKRYTKNNRAVLAAMVAVASIVSSQCSKATSSPTSPAAVAATASNTMALGGSANSAPTTGEIRVCRSAGSNVGGNVELAIFSSTSGTGTFASPIAVAPGECRIAAIDTADSPLFSYMSITDKAEGPVSATVSTISGTQLSGPVAFTNGNTRALNRYHGHTITFVNVVTTPQGVPGRMTGGGSVFTTPNNDRVTHGFELHCDANELPNNLQINWGGHGKNAQQFHLDTVVTAVCTDDPDIAPAPPVAGFDTYTGTGTGRLNGVQGATIEWVFTDAGEPGTKDSATMTIMKGGAVVLTVSGKLKNGNQQAHKQ